MNVTIEEFSWLAHKIYAEELPKGVLKPDEALDLSTKTVDMLADIAWHEYCSSTSVGLATDQQLFIDGFIAGRLSKE